MTPRQKERVSIYRQVIRNCDENPVIVSLWGREGYYLHGFRSAVAAVSSVDYLLSGIKSNHSPNHTALDQFMFPFAETIGNLLVAFSEDSKNESLREKTEYAMDHLQVSARDIKTASLVTLANSLKEWKIKLQSYGISEAIVTGFNITVENFAGTGSSLSNIPAEADAYQDCFGNVLLSANLLLRDHIDPLMEDMSENYFRFYQSYRRIKTYGEINYLF